MTIKYPRKKIIRKYTGRKELIYNIYILAVASDAIRWKLQRANILASGYWKKLKKGRDKRGGELRKEFEEEGGFGKGIKEWIALGLAEKRVQMDN